MSINERAQFAQAVHRKLRAIAAVLLDPAATAHEKDNAEALQKRLEQQITHEEGLQGAWTNTMFALGRRFKEITRSTSPSSAKDDWTVHAFRLGRTLRKALKK